MVEAVNSQTFFRARLPGAEAATAIISIPGLTDQAAANQINIAFQGFEGISGSEVAPGRLTIQFDPDMMTAESLVSRINERTTLSASLESVELPAGAGPTFSLQSVTRYAIWGALAAIVLWGSWGFVRQRVPLPRFVRAKDRSRRRARPRRTG